MITRILAVTLIGGAAAVVAQGSGAFPVCVGADKVLRQGGAGGCPAGSSGVALAIAGPEKPDPEIQTLKAELNDLKQKLNFLSAKVDALSKNPDNSKSTGQAIVEPFEVIDKAGKTLFKVLKSPDHQGGVIQVMNSTGKPVVWISGAANGGFLKTQSSGGFPEVALGSVGSYGGVVIRDTPDQFRASMFLEGGKPYLSLRNDNHTAVATLRQGPSGGGMLELGDAAGNGQVRLGITPGGCGRVETYPERPGNTRAITGLSSVIVGNCP